MGKKQPVTEARRRTRNSDGPGQPADDQIPARGRGVPIPHDPADIRKLVHELQVHQIELESQNEELLKARAEVEAWLDRYMELFDFAPVGYFMLDTQGRILELNLSGASLFGKERALLTGQFFGHYIAPASRELFTSFLGRVYREENSRHPSVELVLDTIPPVIIRAEARAVSQGTRCLLAAMDITGYRQAEEKIRASDQERGILLREIHHRVKNNLQIISSLLDMSRMRAPDTATANALTDMMLKIQTMAQIHTMLYESGKFGRINFGDHVRDQMLAVSTVYSRPHREIARVFDNNEVLLSIDQAIPCALVVSEILTNAYKHAFADRDQGTIRVSIEKTDGRVHIAIRDDGIGLPPDFDSSRVRSLGMKLMKNLIVHQLKGTFSITSGNGTEVVLDFPALP